MGEIVGAGLLSHTPVIMFPEEVRVAVNNGTDFTVATGLKRLNSEVFDTDDYDTVVVIDTHWTTTTETVITSHRSRQGVFTSEEMPNDVHGMPYDLPGDPELAEAVAAVADKRSTWFMANDDEHLPVHYATLNLHSYLGRAGKPWLSASVCQTATVEDFLEAGEVIAEAVSTVDRRVLLLASGALSHKFWPLKEVRARIAGDPVHIVTPQARAADLDRIAWMEAGDHARVIAEMPAYRPFAPEAGFGHYLMLVGALGGSACAAPGVRYSDYENSIGTGHVHMWFDRPAHGWTGR